MFEFLIWTLELKMRRRSKHKRKNKSSGGAVAASAPFGSIQTAPRGPLKVSRQAKSKEISSADTSLIIIKSMKAEMLFWLRVHTQIDFYKFPDLKLSALKPPKSFTRTTEPSQLLSPYYFNDVSSLG